MMGSLNGCVPVRKKMRAFPPALSLEVASFPRDMVLVLQGIPECSSHLVSVLCRFGDNCFTVCRVPSGPLLGTCKKHTCKKYH